MWDLDQKAQAIVNDHFNHMTCDYFETPCMITFVIT